MSQQPERKSDENTSPDLQALKLILDASLEPVKNDISSIKQSISEYSERIKKQDVRIKAIEATRTFWRENWHKVITTSVLCVGAIFAIAIWKGEQDNQIKSNDRIEMAQSQSINELKELVRELAENR
jgi:hypothetical protein